MISRIGWTLAVLLLLAVATTAEAARARFHYEPVDNCGTMQLRPGPCAPGERTSVLGRCPDANPPCPTCMKSFRHLCTGQVVVVPLALPDGTPVIYHRGNRISFNYGSYVVEVYFYADGSVDVVYNSGLLRAL